MTDFQLVGLFFVFMPVMMLGVFWAVNRRSRSIVDNGHRAEATVLSQEYVRTGNGSVWQLEVTYRDFRGASHTAMIGVPRRLEVEADEAVTVIYDTRKPTRVVMELPPQDRRRLPTLPLIAIGAMFVLGLVFIVTAWGERI